MKNNKEKRQTAKNREEISQEASVFNLQPETQQQERAAKEHR
jgi:hypothetical protein